MHECFSEDKTSKVRTISAGPRHFCGLTEGWGKGLGDSYVGRVLTKIEELLLPTSEVSQSSLLPLTRLPMVM